MKTKKPTNRPGPKEVTRYYRTNDCAYLVDCSPDDILAEIKFGRLEARKVGRRWMVHPKALHTWMRRREYGAAQP